MPVMLQTQPIATTWRVGRQLAAISLPPIFALALAACGSTQRPPATTVFVPHRLPLLGGDSNGMNYSTSFIAKFSFEGPPGTDIGGGGVSLWQVKPDGQPSTRGGMCCAGYPREWQPDLKLTVRWLEYRARDGRVMETWYKAENVRIPQYDGEHAGSIWTIFLPDYRVKVVVAGSNANDLAPGAGRPADSDPYVAQGAPDDQWNEWYPGGVAREYAR
jgi:hypothetical protein